MRMKRATAGLAAALSVFGVAAAAAPVEATNRSELPARVYEVSVQIRNRAPESGTSLTPFWVGAHDGEFDLYDRDVPLGQPLDSGALERLVEDGNNDPIVAQFANDSDGEDTVVPGPNGAIGPGDVARTSFFVSAERGERLYFSYASMVLPSNDAFVANGNPREHLLVDGRGRPRQFRVQILGGDVLDGGTEVNTEGPNDTAFLNQTGPDVGIVENGVVTAHPGFNAPQVDPFANILGTPRFANADFTARRYRVADVTVRVERVRANVAARLSGDNEAPAVDTRAAGLARLALEEDGDIDFNLRAREIDNLLFAHIHLGRPGENGPVVATLFNGDPTEDGRLAERGEIDDNDLVGPLEGMTTTDLWQEILDGNAYVNIHSTDFPGGELRANLG